MKNKTGFGWLLLLLAAIAASCDINGIKIPNEAPFADIPSAESLDDGKIVSIKWQADIGADSYILQKSIKGENGFGAFHEIYCGTETVYIDRNIDINISYVYRLDKKRGNKIFEGTEYVVFYRTRPDPFAGLITAVSYNGGTAVHLSWDTDTGADAYIILRCTESDYGNLGIDAFQEIW